MPQTTFNIDQETLEAIRDLRLQVPATGASRIKELLEKHRFNELMNAPTPKVIVTKDGQLRNHAAQREELGRAHLAEVLQRERIIAELQTKLDASDGTTAAYRSVVADMQGHIAKLQEEAVGQDQVTRDRKTFLKLLRQTFGVRIGIVSVNIDALMKLLKFPWAKS
jgi:hypothetical protein